MSKGQSIIQTVIAFQVKWALEYYSFVTRFAAEAINCVDKVNNLWKESN